jgi:hypothetical protein
MSSAARIKIAGLATALFIGALSAAGIAVRADHRQQTAAAAPAATVSPAPNAGFDGPAPSATLEELEDD